jgi:outer membrane immunogenic protein
MVMRLVPVAVLVALAAALVPVWARAADAITVPTSTPGQLAVHNATGFDWNGFYAGVYGGVRGADGSGQYGLGAQAGVNAQFDFYLLGAEVSVQGLAEGDGEIGNTSYGQILGRAGLVVTENVLVYAAGGYGIDLGAPNESDALVGLGVEIAISESVSVEAQYLHGFPLEGGDVNDQMTFGANFHF